MVEDTLPAITKGEGLYVELGNGSNPQKYQLLGIINILQQELGQLRTTNEHVLKESEEQERKIRGLTKKSIHKSMEPVMEKEKKKAKNQNNLKVGGSLIKHTPEDKRETNKRAT